MKALTNKKRRGTRTETLRGNNPHSRKKRRRAEKNSLTKKGRRDQRGNCGKIQEKRKKV